jgi:hypothetical protein
MANNNPTEAGRVIGSVHSMSGNLAPQRPNRRWATKTRGNAKIPARATPGEQTELSVPVVSLLDGLINGNALFHSYLLLGSGQRAAVEAITILVCIAGGVRFWPMARIALSGRHLFSDRAILAAETLCFRWCRFFSLDH